jgi:hypothetical protein
LAVSIDSRPSAGIFTFIVLFSINFIYTKSSETKAEQGIGLTVCCVPVLFAGQLNIRVILSNQPKLLPVKLAHLKIKLRVGLFSQTSGRRIRSNENVT